VPGLLPGMVYSFRVAAVNHVGMSKFSIPTLSKSTCTSEPSPPPQPVCSNITESSCHVGWVLTKSNGAGIEMHELRCYRKGEDIPQWVRPFRYETLGCDVKDLIPGNEYLFEVRSMNRIGWSPWGAALLMKTSCGVPATPFPPTLVSATFRTLCMRIKAPDCSGSRVHSYVVTFRAGGIGRFDKQIIVDAHAKDDTTDFTVENLPADTAYEFCVIARNEVGESTMSAPSSLVSTLPPLCPTPPSNVLAFNVSTNGCEVSWNVDDVDAMGSRVTGFIIHVMEGGKCIQSHPSRVRRDATIRGLLTRHTYTFTVASINAVGEGDSSEESPPITIPTKAEYLVIQHKRKYGDRA